MRPTRRRFLETLGGGMGVLALAQLLGSKPAAAASWPGALSLGPHHPPKAKRVIHLTIKVSKRVKIKVIEGGYKTKEKIFKLAKQDYGVVRKGDKVIGHLAFSAPMLGGKWKDSEEELR